MTSQLEDDSLFEGNNERKNVRKLFLSVLFVYISSKANTYSLIADHQIITHQSYIYQTFTNFRIKWPLLKNVNGVLTL